MIFIIEQKQQNKVKFSCTIAIKMDVAETDLEKIISKKD